MKDFKKRIRRTPWGAYLIMLIAAAAMLLGGYQLGKAGRASVTKPVEAKPKTTVAVAEPTVARVEALQVDEPEEPEQVSLGKFKITHYCACEKCCGEWADGITATGTTATQGRTIAVDPDVIPYGTEVRIVYEDGTEAVYIAEDCGGAIQGNRIDVYMSTHQAALEEGVKAAEIYIEKEANA